MNVIKVNTITALENIKIGGKFFGGKQLIIEVQTDTPYY